MNRFLQQAWVGENSVWRYVLTTVAIVLAAIFSGVVAVPLFGIQPTGDTTTMSPEAFGLDGVTFLAFAVMPFLFAFAMLWFCMRVLHRRSFASLVTPDRIDWRRIGVSGGVWGGIAAASLGVSALFDPDSIRLVFEPNALARLFVVAVLLIPIQAVTEELLFRGYYMQGFSRLCGFGWAGVLLTSVIFGLLHGANAEVAAYGWALSMPYYIGFGVLLGVLTLVDQRMEIAIGIHVVNNLFGTVVATSPESSLPTPALFRLQGPILSVESLLLWGATSILFAFLMSRTYGWTTEDLHRALGRVRAPEPEEDARPAASQPEVIAGDV